MKFKPITLIYGPNSSGKSSIIQSLLLLKQTMNESGKTQEHIIPKGELVNLGSYKDFIYKHDLKNKYSFFLSHCIDNTNNDISFPAELDIRKIGIGIKFSHDEKQSNSTNIIEYCFYINDYIEPISTFSLKEENDDTLASLDIDIFHKIKSLSTRYKHGFTFKASSINKSHPFWKQFAAFNKKDIEKQLGNSFHKELARFKHVLTIIKREEKGKRNKATDDTFGVNFIEKAISDMEEYDRVRNGSIDSFFDLIEGIHKKISFETKDFIPCKFQSDSVNFNFFSTFKTVSFQEIIESNFNNIYSQASQTLQKTLSDIIYIGPLREHPSRLYALNGEAIENVGMTGKFVPDFLFQDEMFLGKVNERLNVFKLGYQLEILKLSKDFFELRLVDKLTKINTSILDVGFGVSQVLPVIVQSMLSKNKTLCIEQPEIHLHPRLQSELGTLLKDCINTPYNNNFIVETHSEHLMLRIQRLIKNKELNSNDVSIIYVNKDENGSYCIELRLDSEGDFIDEWPDGFFEEGYQEMFSL